MAYELTYTSQYTSATPARPARRVRLALRVKAMTSSSSSSVLFHCPCTEPLSVSRPPPSVPPLATFAHHALSSLLFCEECDAIRCDACVACEIACYFCPNCLFEVPSASVRGEKNRRAALIQPR